MSGLAAALGRKGKPVSILAVDDDRFIREILRAIFESEPGVRVVGAGDGAAALARMDLEPFHLAFVDIRMKPMDGPTFCRATRAHPRQDVRRLPLVMMTTEADRDDIGAAKAAGVSGFCLKPLSFDKAMQRALAAIKVAGGGG
jgi:CheY-like chemotaxis protein